MDCIKITGARSNNLKNIDVEMTNELKDQNRVNLSLEFTVGNQIDLHELTFTVQGTN